MTATLDDIVAGLAALTDALTPALSPATRRTWDQQRWVPSPTGFGDVVVTPFATPVLPDIPPNVVAGELITSSWGNKVVDLLKLISVGRLGSTPGGNVGAGAQAQIASISLPAGVHLVIHQALVSTTATMDIALRMFVGGATYIDSTHTIGVVGASAHLTAQVMGLAVLNTAGAVTVNLINNGTAIASTYADPNNHRIFAVQCRN